MPETPPAPEPERRMTPTERLHDLARAAIERQRPDDKPSFDVEQKAPTAEQVKAGILAVYHWRVSVPVCDEFPSSEDAFEAVTRYADELRARYAPLTQSLSEQLERSVKAKR